MQWTPLTFLAAQQNRYFLQILLTSAKNNFGIVVNDEIDHKGMS